MKKKIQKRFILFSMLVFISVSLLVTIMAFLDGSESFFRPRMIIFAVFLLVIIYLASYLLSKIAIKPIEKAWQKQLDFTADASHELRTPLAVFKSNLEIIRENPQETIASQEKWLNNLEQEAERMQHLVEELLELSRADAGQQLSLEEEMPLGIIIRERTEAFESLAKSKNIVISNMIEEDLVIKGNPSSISKLFSVLLDNSIKYMLRPGMISISVKETAKAVIVTYKDDGVGIPKQHLERIFERFYRVDKDRSRRQGGSGLGLAIAKSIVESHGGKIELESEEDAGVTFIITFPRL